MELFEIIGYVASLIIGLSLGLTGAGGSILTVPILVYLFGINPLIATAYSLFIVGVSSSVGAYKSYLKGLLDFRLALTFGVPSFISIYLTRSLLMPSLPADFNLGLIEISKEQLILLSFSAVMLYSAVRMLKRNKPLESKKSPSFLIVVIYGLMVGLVTGFVGAGGGFLIVPALILFMNLDVKNAVANSLFIIFLNSFIGFSADIGTYDIDWVLLLSISSLAIGGVFIGQSLADKISAQAVKRIFAYLILAVAVFIWIAELS